VLPKYTTPFATTGDDSTEPRVIMVRMPQRGDAESKLVKALELLAGEYGCGEQRDDRYDVRASEADIVAFARRYLHEHIGTQVSLGSLAALLDVSAFRLVRSFRRAVGVSPYAYFVQLRVNRAQAMLCQGASIPDVVYSCGFCDQSHFTRTFRRMIGVPPGRYVRSVRQSAA
jgi:transcriptional regulator GlxA family with amidase domain